MPPVDVTNCWQFYHIYALAFSLYIHVHIYLYIRLCVYIHTHKSAFVQPFGSHLKTALQIRQHKFPCKDLLLNSHKLYLLPTREHLWHLTWTQSSTEILYFFPQVFYIYSFRSRNQSRSMFCIRCYFISFNLIYPRPLPHHLSDCFIFHADTTFFVVLFL